MPSSPLSAPFSLLYLDVYCILDAALTFSDGKKQKKQRSGSHTMVADESPNAGRGQRRAPPYEYTAQTRTQAGETVFSAVADRVFHRNKRRLARRVKSSAQENGGKS
ncbi:hypothetical protein B0T10DRAFT_466893 [Thelonectria olida]|uniref:Uncharacterized protein n=1 Tax=Thelonectria olida TaxID=1576542 RepID=A0A9P9AIL6_9HYPO|nr:hypothetical protein B0T10DRAFT_466893 [Thelonectria olida]